MCATRNFDRAKAPRSTTDVVEYLRFVSTITRACLTGFEIFTD